MHYGYLNLVLGFSDSGQMIMKRNPNKPSAAILSVLLFSIATILSCNAFADSKDKDLGAAAKHDITAHSINSLDVAANIPPETVDAVTPPSPEFFAIDKKIVDKQAIIHLTWAGSDNAIRYNVYRNGVRRATTNSTEFIDILDMPRGKLYKYAVRAVGTNKSLSPSSPVFRLYF